MKIFWLTALSFIATVVCDPCQNLSSQRETDECYMKIALDHALIYNPKFPFGALIVDHTTNKISCYGVNSGAKNILLHGETAAFWK
jgi:tRNA(Arg) A34 adenosine deaminase TadA